MKKIMLTLMGVFMLSIFTFAQTGKEQRAIGAAKSQCGNDYTGQGATWYISSASTAICINGGTFEEYTVSVFFSCPPQSLTTCLPAPPVDVATVTYNCDGDQVVTCL